MTGPPDDVARLIAVIDEQRRRHEVLRDRAAARSLTDVAAGVLVGRVGCSPAEAVAHLARLAAGTGVTLAELAADLVGVAADDPLARAARRAPAGSRIPAAHRLAEMSAVHADEETAAALLDELLALTATTAGPHGPAAEVPGGSRGHAPGTGGPGAAAVALWALRPDGALELVGAAGLDPLETSRWRRIPPQMDSLQQRVARAGEAVWWPGRPDRRHRGLPLTGPWRHGARAVLPLLVAGRPTGVLEVCWAAPRREFTPTTRAELTALARACAPTIGADPAATGGAALDAAALDAAALLDGVSDAYLVLSPVRGPGGEVVDLRVDHAGRDVPELIGHPRARLLHRRLAELFPHTVLAGGLLDRAADVLATGRPADAEWPSGPAGAASRVRVAPLLGRISVTWRAGHRADPAAGLLEHAERLGDVGAWRYDRVTGETIWTGQTFALFGLTPSAPAIGPRDLLGHVHPQDREAVRRFHERLLDHGRSAVTTFRLIRADESVRHIRAVAEPVTDPAGVVVALRGAYQDVSARYHSQVALAATRDRLADTEQRAADQQRLALHLQRAIMPPAVQPVSAAGIDVAVRYRPAGEGHLVGGDWYDAVVLPSKEILLAVGDVAGHGLDAVTGMVALRNALRGLAITGAGPAELLGWLNNAAYHLTGGIFATAICAVYDPETRALRWARAGHLPPVLVRGGTAAALPLPAGLLLGLSDDAGYEEARTTLELGDALLLFTDGLIERRDTPLDDALEALTRLASHPVGDAEAFSDRLLAGAGATTNDDTCLVTVHIR